MLAFGVFAGSGKTYEASVTLTNADGIVLFAHNSKKGDIRGAAEDVANKLNDHIKKQGKAETTRRGEAQDAPRRVSWSCYLRCSATFAIPALAHFSSIG